MPHVRVTGREVSEMFAIAAALLFLLALIQALESMSWGVLTVGVLTVAGLLCLALHLVDWGRIRTRP